MQKIRAAPQEQELQTVSLARRQKARLDSIIIRQRMQWDTPSNSFSSLYCAAACWVNATLQLRVIHAGRHTISRLISSAINMLQPKVQQQLKDSKQHRLHFQILI